MPKAGGGFKYEYFIKDHLGNTRLTVQDSSGIAAIKQENHYYPFGMALAGQSWQSPTYLQNRYLYNGKEMQDNLELDWYDYGARFYDPQIGRWSSIDPSAESYRSWTPYNYCLNNPINLIDPDGMDSTDPPGSKENPYEVGTATVIAPKPIPKPVEKPEPPLPDYNNGADRDVPAPWYKVVWDAGYEADNWLEGKGNEQPSGVYFHGEEGKGLSGTNPTKGVDISVDLSGIMTIFSLGKLTAGLDGGPQWDEDWMVRLMEGCNAVKELMEAMTEGNTDKKINKKSTGIGPKTKSNGQSWFKLVEKIDGKLPDTTFRIIGKDTSVYIKYPGSNGFYFQYNIESE